jgi:hypothetical protein
MTDRPFNDGYVESGGIVWTPRELSDTDIEDDIRRISFRLSHKTAKKKAGDPLKLEALLAEQLRREIRRNSGVDPEIGKDVCMAKAKQKVLETIEKSEAKNEDLIVEIRTASGAIWGRTTLRRCGFKTGSDGYTVTDRYRDPENFAPFQLNANLVRIGSKPDAKPVMSV